MTSISELTFQRATVHLVHDAQRLEDGKDLNDALLDFFVKLGQHLIPEGGGPAPVAYLGSHFYDVLRKGGSQDGKNGHKNVANWARRRLGAGGLFGEGIGALAVPVNEVLKDSYNGRPESEERHWWLALLLNPRAVGYTKDCADKDVSLLCLDSFVRHETKFNPPIKALKAGGSLKGYPAEVTKLERQGFCVNVHVRAEGDGSAGALAEPRKSRLKTAGGEFGNRELHLKIKDLGGDSQPGFVEGTLGFRLDRRGAAKTGGEYTLEYGEAGDNYQPPLRLRMGQKPTAFQAAVGSFLGGYLEKEQEGSLQGGKRPQENPGAVHVESAICLPGIPQQETSHDCGFFMLEQILRALQLTPEALRELAQASSVEIAMLPWPSQRQVFRRKARLREAMAALFAEARKLGNGDVDTMLKGDPGLRARIRAALREGGASFTKGYERWAAGDWDLSPSPSRSRSRENEIKANAQPSRSKSGGTSRSVSSRRSKKKKKKRKAKYSSSRSSSSERDTKRRRSRSESDDKASKEKAALLSIDLNTASVVQLRALCVKHSCLPEGIVEKADLRNALMRFINGSSVPPPPPAVVPGQAMPRVRVSKFDMMTPPPAANTAAAPQSAPRVSKFDMRTAPPPKDAAAHAPAPRVSKFDMREPPPPKDTKFMGLNIPAPEAKVPSVIPTGDSFTRASIEAMSSKELRNLCIKHKVLPAGSVERSELLQALAPLAKG